MIWPITVPRWSRSRNILFFVVMVNKNEQPVANKVLRKLSQDELNKIIARHKLFRRGAARSVRANLSQVDLSHLTLAGQDMSHADFTGSVLAA